MKYSSLLRLKVACAISVALIGSISPKKANAQASAQQLTQEEQAAFAEKAASAANVETDKKVATPTPNPSITSLISSYTQIALSAKSGNQEASGTLGLKVGDAFVFSATLKQVLQDKTPRVTPLTLDGLQGGASATIGFQWAPPIVVSSSLGNAAYMKVRYQQVYNALDSARVRYAFSRKFIKSKHNLTPAERAIVDTLKISSIGVNQFNEAAFELAKAGVLTIPHWVFGLSGSVGKVKYDYITDTNSKQPTSLSGVNRNVRGYAGYILGPKSVAAFSYTFQRKYKTVDDDPISFYYPVSSANGTLTTKDVFVGEPILTTSSRISIEYRRLCYFNAQKADEAQPFLSVVPSAHLLTNTQKVALNMALYFLQIDDTDAKQHGLQGGVAFGYLTNKNFDWQPFAEGFSAEVFIAAPFNLFDFSK